MSAWEYVNYEEFGKYIMNHFDNLMGLKHVDFGVDKKDSLIISLYIDLVGFTIDALTGKDKKYIISKIQEGFVIDAGCHGIPLNMEAGTFKIEYKIIDFENNKEFSFVNGEIDFFNYVS